MRRFLMVCLAFLVSAAPMAHAIPPQAAGLRIVVLEGEDGVNILQQKSAVQPVVEVRDQNNLPVAGASVVFLIGNGSKAATFANGASQITVVTDAAGRAAVSGLQPVSNGAYSIQVSASAQGQTATATISQTNFANAAQAAQAGKVPGSQSGSSASSGGSGAGSGAGAGAGAGAGGGLSGAAIGGIAAGAVAGGVVAAKAASGGDSGSTTTPPPTTTTPPPTTPTPPPTTPTPPPTTPTPPPTTPTPPPTAPVCTTQVAALQASADRLSGIAFACINATTQACLNQFAPEFNVYFEALNNVCSCLGNFLTDEQRAALREAYVAWQELGADIGYSVPPIPACFR